MHVIRGKVGVIEAKKLFATTGTYFIDNNLLMKKNLQCIDIS